MCYVYLMGIKWVRRIWFVGTFFVTLCTGLSFILESNFCILIFIHLWYIILFYLFWSFVNILPVTSRISFHSLLKHFLCHTQDRGTSISRSFLSPRETNSSHLRTPWHMPNRIRTRLLIKSDISYTPIYRNWTTYQLKYPYQDNQS